MMSNGANMDFSADPSYSSFDAPTGEGVKDGSNTQPGGDIRPFYCSECDIDCKTERGFSGHTRSMIHTQKVMDNSSEVQSVPAPNQAAPLATTGTSSQAAGGPNKDKDKEGFLHCEVCDCTCSGEVNFQAHISGSRHQKNVKNREIGAPITKRKGSSRSIATKHDAQLQPRIDHCKEPLVGLQFVTEFQKQGKPTETQYVCNLCEAKCDANNVIPHVVGYKHRMNYLKENYMNYFTTMRQQGQKKSEQTTQAEEYARTIEAEEGRKALKVKIELDPFYDPARPNSGSQARVKPSNKPAQLITMVSKVTEPIIGLGYIIEYQKEGVGPEGSHYVCGLCESKCDASTIRTHILGHKHRVRYMEQHYLEYAKAVKEKKGKKSEQSALSEEYARTIEAEKGRGKPQVKIEMAGFEMGGKKRPFQSPTGGPANKMARGDGGFGRGRGRGGVDGRGQGRGRGRDDQYGQQYGGFRRDQGFGRQSDFGYGQRNSGGFGNSGGLGVQDELNMFDFSRRTQVLSMLGDEILGDSITELLRKLANRTIIITTEEDASLGLKVSNALTQALLDYRLTSIPKLKASSQLGSPAAGRGGQMGSKRGGSLTSRGRFGSGGSPGYSKPSGGGQGFGSSSGGSQGYGGFSGGSQGYGGSSGGSKGYGGSSGSGQGYSGGYSSFSSPKPSYGGSTGAGRGYYDSQDDRVTGEGWYM